MGGVCIGYWRRRRCYPTQRARASIAAARFPPHGHRSYPPFACTCLQRVLGRIAADISFIVIPGAQQAADVAIEHCAVIPQIKSGLGVQNLEEMMQIEGVDAISATS